MKIKALLVDDDDQDSRNLITRIFAENEIEVIYAKTAEEMEEKLPSIYSELSAIILDIKGKKYENQEIEHRDFLTYSIGILDRNNSYKDIDRFICSGSPDDYEIIQSTFTNEQVFTKSKDDIKKLSQKVKEIGQVKEPNIIRNKYSDIFDAIRKTDIDKNYESTILEILKNLYFDYNIDYNKDLAEIRKINEFIYKRVTSILGKSISPNNENNHETFSSFNRILAGNRDYRNKAKITTEYHYKDITIEHAINTIHWVGSYHGSHDDWTLNSKDNDPENFPTKYTLYTLIFSLLDVIIWYSRICQEQKNV